MCCCSQTVPCHLWMSCCAIIFHSCALECRHSQVHLRINGFGHTCVTFLSPWSPHPTTAIALTSPYTIKHISPKSPSSLVRSFPQISLMSYSFPCQYSCVSRRPLSKRSYRGISYSCLCNRQDGRPPVSICFKFPFYLGSRTYS